MEMLHAEPCLWDPRPEFLYNCVLCLVAQSCPILCNPMDCSPPGSSVHRDSPGKNTGVDCHALLQGIFPTQKSNTDLPHCRQILYHLSHQALSNTSPMRKGLLIAPISPMKEPRLRMIWLAQAIPRWQMAELKFKPRLVWLQGRYKKKMAMSKMEETGDSTGKLKKSFFSARGSPWRILNQWHNQVWGF